MKTHYSWFEVENAKNDISQKYQYLLKQQDKTIYSYITENSELKQEIKNTIKFGEKLFKINPDKDASLEARTFGDKLAEMLRGRFRTYTSFKVDTDPDTKARVCTIFGSTNFSDLEEK